MTAFVQTAQRRQGSDLRPTLFLLGLLQPLGRSSLSDRQSTAYTRGRHNLFLMYSFHHLRSVYCIFMTTVAVGLWSL